MTRIVTDTHGFFNTKAQRRDNAEAQRGTEEVEFGMVLLWFSTN